MKLIRSLILFEALGMCVLFGTLALRAQTLDQIGQWSGVVNLPLVPIHVNLLPTGEVLMWNHAHVEIFEDACHRHVKDNPTPYVWKYDAPMSQTNPSLVSVPDVFANGTHTDEIYCSGHSFLPDGRLLIAGGHLSKWNSDAKNKTVNLEFTGSPQIHFFNSTSRTWVLNAVDMSNGRWYPTTLPLGNGNNLLIGGIIDQVVNSCQPVDDYNQNTTVEVYDFLTGAVTALNPSRRLPTYPWMYRAPTERAFYAGPGPDTGFLTLTGGGSWGPPITTTFGAARSASGPHQSTSVMYNAYKLMNVGGVNMSGLADSQNYLAPTTAWTEVIDLSVASPTWRSVAPMNRPRQQLTATLLPDGKVLVTGGKMASNFDNADGAVMEAETWDPATESWSLLAAMSVPRLHHSFALLLPDGRVMVGGGGETGFPNEVSYPSVQFFSPPYLFKGTRPVITSVSSPTLRYGQPFSIQTSANNIGKVSLIRLGAVSHGFNFNQGVAQLAFKKNNRTKALDVAAFADRNLVPPGHYLLFIVTNSGVPSVAKIIQVTS
jgi:hypothetical protein